MIYCLIKTNANQTIHPEVLACAATPADLALTLLYSGRLKEAELLAEYDKSTKGDEARINSVMLEASLFLIFICNGCLDQEKR